MDLLQLVAKEKISTGTSWTNNKQFDKDGYLFVQDLFDAKELYHPVPKERGQINYFGKTTDNFYHNPVEAQVPGSLARYWHPQYRDAHTKIRLKVEELIGRKLYNTYYYDRFYFPGQALNRHVDRDACEISVTIHISTNLSEGEEDWPIWIKTPDQYKDKKKTEIETKGEEKSLILKPGDGMLYKGCERPHWREEMPGANRNKEMFGKGEELYYHQIFFHYVLQDGLRAHCAYDAAK